MTNAQPTPQTFTANDILKMLKSASTSYKLEKIIYHIISMIAFNFLIIKDEIKIINTAPTFGDIFNIKNGYVAPRAEGGRYKLYNGGEKIYRTNDKKHLLKDIEYLIIHKVSGTITHLKSGLNCVCGNNAFYCELKEEYKGEVLPKFIYYTYHLNPKLIKNLRIGSCQQSINIMALSGLKLVSL